MKKIVSLILTVAMLFAIAPVLPQTSYAAMSGECGENVTYTLDDNGVLTISGTGDMKDWSYWTSERTPWMSGKFLDAIKSVVIMPGITSIGDLTFDDCHNIESVKIPDTVMRIGARAFMDCRSLKTITIPDSVYDIGEGAFIDCASLTSINVGPMNDYFCSVDGNLLTSDMYEFIQYAPGKPDTSYAIPEEVDTICAYAFGSCKNLINITMSDDVVYIGKSAFSSTDNLKSIKLSESLETIESSAFLVSGLEKLYIPELVTFIGEDAVNTCADITVAENNPEYSSQDGVLFNKNKTELITYPTDKTAGSYVVPDGVRTIGYHAFWESKLVDITIPESVKHIEQAAFVHSNSLTDVYYKGTKTKWAEISIDENNDKLLNANIHYEGKGSGTIKVIVNGDYVEFDYPPIIKDDRTLVPIRAIAEALGSNVEWDQSTQTAVIQRGLDTAVFQINKNKAFAKRLITLDVAAQVINDRTYIPVRAVSEIFGASVQWDENTKTVIIDTEELTDEAIFSDFCDNGFLEFDYFAHCFMNEHMSGGIFNSYMWQNTFSNLSEWAKRTVTFQAVNYEKDLYKENLKTLLSGITNTVDPDVTKMISGNLASAIADGLGKTSDFAIDELGNFLYENSDKLGNEFLDNAEWAGNSIEDFGTSFKLMGASLNIAALTVEDIAYLLADFTQNQKYLQIIKEAAASGDDKDLQEAIDELMAEYNKKYMKFLGDIDETLSGIVTDKLINATLGLVGSTAGSLYSISVFAIEQGAKLAGAKHYSDNVESAIVLMGIHNNIVMDNYNKIKQNIQNHKVSESVTEGTWKNFVDSFEVTKACTIEAYKCMLEVTEDAAERKYLEKQIDIATRLCVSASIPSNDRIFYLEQ